MNEELFREFERVCALFFEDLDRFVQSSEAEVKEALQNPATISAHKDFQLSHRTNDHLLPC